MIKPFIKEWVIVMIQEIKICQIGSTISSGPGPYLVEGTYMDYETDTDY